MTRCSPATHRSKIGILVLLVALAETACSRHQPSSAHPEAGGTPSAPATVRPVDWTAVDEALGRRGDAMPGDVHRYAFPRSDLKVTLDGVTLQAGFALGSYAAFAPTREGAFVMGDLVLTENEVSPVVTKLQQEGLDVTAVHNHLLREQPKLMYVHYLGQGLDATGLARGLRAALEASATPLGPPAAGAPGGDLGFDPAELDRILGRTGKTGGGLQRYAIGRAEAVTMQDRTMGDVALTPGLGVGTVINFQPLGSGRAATTGDFALLGREVAPVTRALRSHAIEVTAVHTHMTDDQPHLYYVHFYAAGPAGDLARGLRAALDETNSARDK